MVNEHQQRCKEYLRSRVSDYEFRCKRFSAVADRLARLGLTKHSAIVDVGSGRGDFEQYMREARGWLGDYTPIDGSIDGADLNHWNIIEKPYGPTDHRLPPRRPDFYVAIEIIEHLKQPCGLIAGLKAVARKGVVMTTPNCECIDVLNCDTTHVSIVPAYLFEWFGYDVDRTQLFNDPEDSLVAYIRSI